MQDQIHPRGLAFHKIKNLSQTFTQFKRDADTLGLTLDSVVASLLGAVSNLAQQIRQPVEAARTVLKTAIAEIDGSMTQLLANTQTAALSALQAYKKDSSYDFGSLRSDQAMTLVNSAQTAILANYQQQENIVTGKQIGRAHV